MSESPAQDLFERIGLTSSGSSLERLPCIYNHLPDSGLQIYRPLRKYDFVYPSHRDQVKPIKASACACLSLKMHTHLVEHWAVVRGAARVTRGTKNYFNSESESTYISIGQQLRLENPGSIPLELIEVQSLTSLGEDGFVRFEYQCSGFSG